MTVRISFRGNIHSISEHRIVLSNKSLCPAVRSFVSINLIGTRYLSNVESILFPIFIRKIWLGINRGQKLLAKERIEWPLPTHEFGLRCGCVLMCVATNCTGNANGVREGESRPRRRGDDSTVYRRLVSVVWWGLRGSRHGEGAVPRHPPYRWHVLRKECRESVGTFAPLVTRLLHWSLISRDTERSRRSVSTSLSFRGRRST